MAISLNLASRPFGRHRALYLAAGLAGSALIAAAILMVTSYARSYRRSPEMERMTVQHRRELEALKEKQSRLEAVLRRQENSAVLTRSIFLNQLLLRKGISWTRTFSDLEQLMPPRVRLIGLRPQLTPDNEITLDLEVGTETREAFLEFLMGLESSTLFRSPELRSDSPPTENQPLYRFRMSVIYEQKL